VVDKSEIKSKKKSKSGMLADIKLAIKEKIAQNRPKDTTPVKLTINMAETPTIRKKLLELEDISPLVKLFSS
jgi:hypothetical protein